MKKITTLLLMTAITVFSFAQQNLFESLAEYNGVTFTKYRHYESDGVHKISDPSTKAKVNILNNEFGKPIAFELEKTDGSGLKFEYNYKFDKTDHYTEPAFLWSYRNLKDAFMMVEGYLFQFDYAAEDLSKYGFVAVWIPETAKEGAEEGSKKGGFKAKLAGALGGGLPDPKVKELLDMDITQMLEDYLSDMKTKQQNTKYTAQELNEIAAMELAIENDDARIKAANNEYWASDEGQAKIKEWNKKSGSSSSSSMEKYTVVNTGSSSVKLRVNGDARTLNPGDTWELHCGTELFYSQKGENGVEIGKLITDGKSSCGGNFNL